MSEKPQVPPLNTSLSLPLESMLLAWRLLQHSTLPKDAELVTTDVEDVGGRPLIFFEFRRPGSHDKDRTRLYAD